MTRSSGALAQLFNWQNFYGQSLEDEIDRWICEYIAPAEFALLLRYPLGHVDEQGNKSAASGKRSRSLLCLASCTAVGGRWQNALPVAAAIELLHNFSLIHDDIEDSDPIRHHRPAVWKVWGEAFAINAGDAMFALAGRAVGATTANADTALHLLRRFHEVAIQLTRGQHLDMSFESRADVSPHEYLEMISLKTASLIGYAMEAGAVVGGAEEETHTALRRYGENLGMAFQMQDDLMGIWGSSGVTGKAATKDLENGKKTLPVLLARTETVGGDAVDRYLRGADVGVPEIVDQLNRSGVQHQVRLALRQYLATAFEALAEAAINEASTSAFIAVAEELTGGNRVLTPGS